MVKHSDLIQGCFWKEVAAPVPQTRRGWGFTTPRPCCRYTNCIPKSISMQVVHKVFLILFSFNFFMFLWQFLFLFLCFIFVLHCTNFVWTLKVFFPFLKISFYLKNNLFSLFYSGPSDFFFFVLCDVVELKASRSLVRTLGKNVEKQIHLCFNLISRLAIEFNVVPFLLNCGAGGMLSDVSLFI